MKEFIYECRNPIASGLQSEGSTIYDPSNAKAFGKDARQDGLLLCHNPYNKTKASNAWCKWFEGWAQ